MSAKKSSETDRKSLMLKALGEDELIGCIARWASEKTKTGGERKFPPWGRMQVDLSIGDDTAVVRTSPKAPPMALTTDMMVEGTHFLSDHPPEELGAKAVASNLSDLAAMGAWPAWILISLGAPGTLSLDWMEAFYRGVRRIIAPFGCLCLGGDCVASKKVVINIVAGGNCDPKARLPLRSQAQEGQHLYVTGSLGDSGAGLFSLMNPRRVRGMDGSRDLEHLLRRHRDPTPRIEAGAAIARLLDDAAMMDLSDGLLIDLERLAKASGCGFEVRTAALPISPSLKRLSGSLGRSACDFALCGGEDYELLFTTARPFDEWRAEVARAGPGRPLRLTRIGRVLGGAEKISYLDGKGCEMAPPKTGFRHF